MSLLNLSGIYTDLYQLTMGQVYFLNGKAEQPAVFDYFFRKLPFNGGYVIFAGLQDLIHILENLQFTPEDIKYLASLGLRDDYLKYLKNFRFTGTIFSSTEGDLVFPTRPVLRVESTMLEAQIIETLLLNQLNFQSLIATKAARMRQVAGNKILSDFGLRRAHALGGYAATRAAIIGGFDSTSNVKAGLDYGIPVAGTMAHSFIQSYEDELKAFQDFSQGRPEDCVLLVDTYDTLKSGVPNAIKVAREMAQNGQKLLGIRLDSGDLAYLSKKARKMLDDEGLHDVKIAASNQLDEYVIKSLISQKAPIDIFGVGTNLVTGQPDAALDGVYKLSYTAAQPRIKLSENIKKTTLPHKKQVWRLYDSENKFFGADVVGLHDQEDIKMMYHPFESHKQLNIKGYKKEPVLHKVMEKGKSLIKTLSVQKIREYAKHQVSLLPEEYKRFEYPHTYKVGISTQLKTLRDELQQKYKS